MPEPATTRLARAIVEHVGSNPKRYVPGTLLIAGRSVDWTERCRSRACPHVADECHVARTSHLDLRGSIDGTRAAHHDTGHHGEGA